MKQSQWWREAILYQIYPRSFQDSNGDGIGDLRGVINRIDHLKDLGINTVWICPFYDSPDDDNGYDIRDYRKIHSEFGDMETFEELLEKLHAADIRLVIDLVVNHSSDEHYWFQEAINSKNNEYSDYYIFKDADREIYNAISLRKLPVFIWVPGNNNFHANIDFSIQLKYPSELHQSEEWMKVEPRLTKQQALSLAERFPSHLDEISEKCRKANLAELVCEGEIYDVIVKVLKAHKGGSRYLFGGGANQESPREQ